MLLGRDDECARIDRLLDDATVGRGTRMFTFRRLSVDVPTRRVPGLIPILGREEIFERLEASFDIRRDAITLRLSR